MDLFSKLLGHRKNPAQANRDQILLAQLRRAGADLSMPREVLHYLYMPTREAGEVAADALRAKGYSAQVRASASAMNNPANPILVLATTRIVVSPQAARESRQLFEGLAEFHHGEYDGWEAAVQP